MFKKKIELKETFISKSNDTSFLFNTNNLFYIFPNKKIEEQSLIGISKIFDLKKQLIAISNNTESYLINLLNRKSEDVSNKEILFFNEEYIIYNNHNTFPSKLENFNLNQFKLNWISDDFVGSYKCFYKNKIFYHCLDPKTFSSTNMIKCIDLETGNEVKSISFEEKYPNHQIFQLLGVSNNILIIALTNDVLIGLDYEKGKIVWERKGVHNGIYISNEKGIYEQFMIAYACFDISTGEMIKNYKDYDYFEKFGIETQRNNYVKVGIHLITTDYRKGKIGAFNTETYKFDWVYEQAGISFPGGIPMEYNEPYLFVQDNNNTLHIFEKDK